MSVLVDWFNSEKTIILQTFEGKWTWEEFNKACATAAELMRTVEHEVHLVSDFIPSISMPVGGAIRHAQNVTSQYPSNWGLLVVISDKKFIEMLVNSFRRIFSRGVGGKTYHAETFDEAKTIISQYEKESSS